MGSLRDSSPISGTIVADLARFAKTDVVSIVELALGGSTSRTTANGTSERKATPGVTNVARGGLRLDHVLNALSSSREPSTLKDVQSQVGGSVPQVRAALKKLAKAGKVKITGERRGTRYLAR